MNSQIVSRLGVPDILTEEGKGIKTHPPSRAFLLVAKEMS